MMKLTAGALALMTLMAAPVLADKNSQPGAEGGAVAITPAVQIDGVDFGDDASQWSNDNECDDPRFSGPGMTTTPLLEEDIGHDASDCAAAWRDGRLRMAKVKRMEPIDGIEFGDDASQFSNDNECDDPRFEGEGMTTTPLRDQDIEHDASDCAAAYRDGRLALRKVVPIEEVDFGDDAGEWANDGECDDPRFEGEGMTETMLLESDIRHDASDCRSAYEAGKLRLR